MELSGLEPLTSWVRFARKASLLIADGFVEPLFGGWQAVRFVVGRDHSLCAFDQNLTSSR